MNTLFKRYFSKTLIVCLYGFFFITQLFSVTPDAGFQNGTLSFWGSQNHYHIHFPAPATVQKRSSLSSGITQKNVAAFRLNKRFHPEKWIYIRALVADPVPDYDNNPSQQTGFSEAPLLSVFLHSKHRRGPPSLV